MFFASIPTVTKEMAGNVEQLLTTAGHYPPSDAPLFIYSYNLLAETLENKEARVLEVCSGYGQLLIALARRFPKSDFVGIDQNDLPRPDAANVSNLKFRCGDAIDLKGIPDGSFDLIVGQATMHHLSNNLGMASREYLRVLKPGGKCVFIYEPLGHSWLVATVRVIRTSMREMVDESNLYLSTLKTFGEGFSETRVGCFNLIGYFAKIIRIRRPGFFLRLNACDQMLARLFPSLVKHCANFTVCYTK
jgi:SAM-dependent methyltransferase